jgi:hypothetical protein
MSRFNFGIYASKFPRYNLTADFVDEATMTAVLFQGYAFLVDFLDEDHMEAVIDIHGPVVLGVDFIDDGDLMTAIIDTYPVVSLTAALTDDGDAMTASLFVPDVHFVAVSSTAGLSATSPDGDVWTQRTMPSSVVYRQVAYSPTLNRWVAVGGAAGSGVSSVAYSDNHGAAWTAVSGTTSETWYAVAWFDDGTNKYFVAYRANSAGTTYNFMYSTDGITWTTGTTGDVAGLSRMQVSPMNGGGVMAWCAEIAGSPDQYWYTKNGTTWAKSAARTNPDGTRIDPSAYRASDDKFVSAPFQISGSKVLRNTTKAFTTWTDPGNITGITTMGQWTFMRYVPELTKFFVAGYGGAGNNSIADSTDGKAFTERSVGAAGVILQDLCYSPGKHRLVMVGSGGKIYYSDNSTSWSAATTVPNLNYSHVLSDQ